jgi:hypothetical protein
MTGRVDGLVVPTHEPWVTKQQIAAHLHVTTRWIESQQRLGLPHMHMLGINRYRVTEVEAWLRGRYSTPRAPEGA